MFTTPLCEGFARRAILAAFLCVAFLALPAEASAHDDVTASVPAADAMLPGSPSEIVLTMSSEPLDVGASIMVVDADGVSWEDGDTSVAGKVVTQSLSAPLPAGDYQVRWRVVSGDGHPVSGSYQFAVRSSAAGTPTPVAEATPSTRSEVVAPVDEQGDDAAGESASDPDDASAESVPRTALYAVAGAVGALVLFTLGRLAAAHRGSNPKEKL